jgi:transcription termination factor Rho
MTEDEFSLSTDDTAPVKKRSAKKAPAKKATVKKTAAKKTAVPAAEAPPPAKKKTVSKKKPAAAAPVAAVEAAAPPAKKKTAAKRKATGKAAASPAPAPEVEAVPLPPPPPPVAEAPPPPEPPVEREFRDHRGPRPERSHHHAHPHQNGQPPQQQLGPDGQPRRLTKWERWKLRKEKFKQMKQQRYLEKQARLQGGGENGSAQSDGAPAQEIERHLRPEYQPGPPEDCAGLLELTPGKGFGFLRPKERNFAPLQTDPFVTPEIVRNLGLRDGLWVEAVMRRGGRGPQVIQVKSVNGREPEAYRMLPLFEELTAINPTKRYILETSPSRYTTRLIDFISPIGRGQRGLIVAPPRAGKTTILQHIAEAVRENYPEIKLIVLLVDERPEEVTELARALPGAEIMASNNDRDPREHIRIAALAMERARRLVEAGEHVFMLLDSITRLARAFNNAIRGHGGGKGSLSGGVDARALEGARRMFASARNTREAGSLTIVGTALVETNSRADDLIFQEFKGTGNMELVLDRRIAQQYIYPAVDIFKSGTRREELLLPPHQMEKVHVIRRGLAGHKPVEAVERLIHFMERFNNNAQLLVEIKSRE